MWNVLPSGHTHMHTRTLWHTHTCDNKARERRQDSLWVWVRVEKDDSYGLCFPSFSLLVKRAIQSKRTHTHPDTRLSFFLSWGATSRKGGWTKMSDTHLPVRFSLCGLNVRWFWWELFTLCFSENIHVWSTISVSQDYLDCFSCIMFIKLKLLSLSLFLLLKPIRWLVVEAKKEKKSKATFPLPG